MSRVRSTPPLAYVHIINRRILLTLTGLQYLENVINSGDYSSAYFEISYVKAFTSASDTFVPTVSGGSTVLVSATSTGTAATGSSTGSTSSSGNSNSTSTGSGSGNGAAEVASRVYVAVLAGSLLSLFTWAMI